MSDGEGFELTMELEGGYRFLVDFAQPSVPPLLLDEPEPLGEGEGPNAAKVSPRQSATASAPARCTACGGPGSTSRACAPR